MNSDELPERLVIYSSRWKMGLVALGCAGFVVGCLAILILHDPSVVDYAFCFLGLAFFGGCAAASTNAVFMPSRMTLDDAGCIITGPLNRVHRIQWEDISEVRFQSPTIVPPFLGSVQVQLKQGREPRGIIGQLKTPFGRMAIQSGWRMKPERIAETMRAFHARHERSCRHRQ